MQQRYPQYRFFDSEHLVLKPCILIPVYNHPREIRMTVDSITESHGFPIIL
ncbi:MAG TPA: hypothetical protein EYQ00_13635, partial [Dehalococcoidia bacterium]|nr:hypothetical protein [Dehalococcoidia bacterium]